MRDRRSSSALLLFVLCTLLVATAAHAAPNGVAPVQPAAAPGCASASLPSWDPALLATPQMTLASRTTDLPEAFFPSICPPPCLGCTAAECRTAHCFILGSCRMCAC
jgi:hypothetical protein